MAAKGEGWAPPFISCAQDTVDLKPNCSYNYQAVTILQTHGFPSFLEAESISFFLPHFRIKTILLKSYSLVGNVKMIRCLKNSLLNYLYT